MKKHYPRLPVCILADGLYPYEGAFEVCEKYEWKYIFVLQSNSLKTVQEELVLTKRRSQAAEYYTVKNGLLDFLLFLITPFPVLFGTGKGGFGFILIMVFDGRNIFFSLNR